MARATFDAFVARGMPEAPVRCVFLCAPELTNQASGLPGTALFCLPGLFKGDCFIDRMPRLELLLIAASTGITQMKSILEFLLGKGLQHPVHLYWGVLHSSDLYLNEQCQKWAQQHAGFHYVPVVSEPQNDPDWQGRKGLVGEVALSDFARVSPGTGFRRAWHGACHL